MTIGICISIIIVLLITFILGANIGYLKGQQDSCEKWLSYIKEKEKNIAELQHTIKELQKTNNNQINEQK